MSATKAMCNYAKAIAEKLNLDEPDFSNYQETSLFISEYSEQFKRTIARERTINDLNKLYGKIDKKLTDEFIVMLDDLDYMCGLYFFYENFELRYIGKSINLKERIYSSLHERIKECNGINKVYVFITDTEADMHICEPLFITCYKPTLNKEFSTTDMPRWFEAPEPPKVETLIDIFEG